MQFDHCTERISCTYPKLNSNESRGPGARPLSLLKLVKKKMTAARGRRSRESSSPPSDKFLDPLLLKIIQNIFLHIVILLHFVRP